MFCRYLLQDIEKITASSKNFKRKEYDVFRSASFTYYMNKNALVITYHVKNCQRVGGFHYFINYLEDFSYDIDWVVSPVSFSWVYHNNDKENFKNFIDLWNGIEFEEKGVKIRHFSVPIFMPAKIAKLLKMNLGENYWPKWQQLKKKLKTSYDIILIEGVGCQYALDLKKDYPNARIIYRPSDILETFSNVPNPMMLEKNMIETANFTACVDENQLKYYKKFTSPYSKILVLRNPITTNEDIDFLMRWTPKKNTHKTVVYIGVSGIDLNLIEFAATQNVTAEFIVIGPFEKKSHDNVKYLGTLTKMQYLPYLENADVGVNPLSLAEFNHSKNTLVGYTRKITNYMRFLLPVVTTGSDNYLHLKGFYNAQNANEFSDYIRKALTYSVNDRIALKSEYLMALELFLESKTKSQFFELIEGSI